MKGGALARGRVFGMRRMRLSLAALVAARLALLLRSLRRLGLSGCRVGLGAPFGSRRAVGQSCDRAVGGMRFLSATPTAALFRLGGRGPIGERGAFCVSR